MLMLSCSRKEYSFNVDHTGYTIYAGKHAKHHTVIGRLNYGDNPTLDSLIDSDNQ